MSDELKTPWAVKSYGVCDVNEKPLAIVEEHISAAIVHRVNCHDKLVEALERARMEIGDLLSGVYQSATPVCCGRPCVDGSCCGCPDPAWDKKDEELMDHLSPIHRNLSAALELAKGGNVE